MKKNYLIIPALIFALVSCGGAVQNENNDNIEQNDDNKGEETNPNPDVKPDEGGETQPDIKPDQGGDTTPDTKPDTKPDQGGDTTPDTKPDEKPDEKPDPEIPHKDEKLPNGLKKIAAPDNLYKPLDCSEWQNFDCSQYVPDNWKYIYGNNSTRGDFYTEYHENVALKFGDKNRGVQTPALKKASKHEVRFTINGKRDLHGTDEPRNKNKPETFLIYGFNNNQDVIYESYYTPFKEGINKDRKDTFDLKFYVENKDVSYIEIRLNDRLFNDQANSKYVNFGVHKLSIKSYNY